MMAPKPDLNEFAAYAATNGQYFDESTAVFSLKQGEYAAQHGRVIPLPVLLDVVAIMASLQVGRPYYLRELRPGSATMQAYDDWLLDFCTKLHQYLGYRQESKIHGPDDRIADYLPSLISGWPENKVEDDNCLKWANIYHQAWHDQPTPINQILTAWRGKRKDGHYYLGAWFSDSHGNVKPDKVSGMWGSFLATVSTKHLHESFDHTAAHIFLGAKNPPILSRQQKLIQELRHNQQAMSLPFTTSYDEQDPNHGVIALSALCAEEYGDFQIINNTMPKITNLFSGLPKAPVLVHMIWATTFASLLHSYAVPDAYAHLAAPDQLKATTTHGQQTAVSALQGVAALLMDDWRSALQGLDIFFYAHNGKPNPDMKADQIGKAGPRWKAHIDSGGPLPPPRVVAKFFRRHTWLDPIPDDGLRWESVRGESRFSWWVAFLLVYDLPAFGFRQHTVDVDLWSAKTIWQADDSSLSKQISHVILLDPIHNNGNICQAIHDSGRVLLRPLRWPDGVNPGKRDPSYRALRTFALDVLLDVLLSIYRTT